MPKEVSGKGKGSRILSAGVSYQRKKENLKSQAMTQRAINGEDKKDTMSKRDVLEGPTDGDVKIHNYPSIRQSHDLVKSFDGRKAASLSNDLLKYWRAQIPKVQLRLNDGNDKGKIIDGQKYYQRYLDEASDAELEPGSYVRSMDVDIILEIPGANRVLSLGSFVDLSKEKSSEVFARAVLQLPQDEVLLHREDGLQAIAVVSIMLSDGVLGLKEPILATQLDRFLNKEIRTQAYSAAMRTFLMAGDLRLFHVCMNRGGSALFRSDYGDECVIELACRGHDARFLRSCLDSTSLVNNKYLLAYLLEGDRCESVEMKTMLRGELRKLSVLDQ